MKKIVLKNKYQEELMKEILKHEEETMLSNEKKDWLANAIQTVREFRQQIE